MKNYIGQLLMHPQPDYFKHILAITFTNKAVAEMKNRILDILMAFSEGDFTGQALSMATIFEGELGLPSTEIQKKSQRILKNLLNSYALFSIETIDHFNHRLLRTFSRDLKLKSNFEVSLEMPVLLSEAVDLLIAKAGKNQEVTKWLIHYALQKTEEDKSWDISRDLNKTASLLTQENDWAALELLREKSLVDFAKLRDRLYAENRTFEDTLSKKARALYSTINSHGLEASHFSRGTAYNFIKGIVEGNFDINIHAAWMQKIDVGKLYPGRVKGSPQAEIIDTLVPEFDALISVIQAGYPTYALNRNILNHLIPLATVHLVDSELQDLKNLYNVLPISEFNNLIHHEIKDQPAPFIYERLGERYRHFFIDEFQDTSLLQWQNLMPLAENALAQSDTEDQGSVMIVGDAKQSIYRWRGGLPEQFIGLYGDENPFPFVKKKIENLNTNYRSCQSVVTFNNEFFSLVASTFGDSKHENLYRKGNDQNWNHDCEGYVEIDFLPKGTAEETLVNHPLQLLKKIKPLLERGYKPGDICVLTRKKSEGVAISEVLSKNGLSVVSDETLLLKNAPEIQALIHILQLSIFPDNDEVMVASMAFILAYLDVDIDTHVVLKSIIKCPISAFESELHALGINLRFAKAQSLGTFETLEYFVQALRLNKHANPFVATFMDWVHQFVQNPQNSKWELLAYWELKKKDLSITAANTGEAIRVMTIHKSKGLEFPVVFFPFAHLDIHDDKNAKAWYPWNDDGFEYLLMGVKQEIEIYNETAAEIYRKHRQTLELDNINLLYVALTRAQQELYIIANEGKNDQDPKTYSDLLLRYLKEKGTWSDQESLYAFGKKNAPVFQEDYRIGETLTEYPIQLPETHQIKMVATRKHWEMDATEAREFGNLFHDVMAGIRTKEDLDMMHAELVENKALPKSLLTQVTATVQKLMDAPDLSSLFDGSDEVYLEKDIITSKGVLRPDRVNIHANKSATIVDYKTGVPKEWHEGQITEYANALEQMGYPTKNRYLVYVSDDAIIINKP